MVTKEYRLLKAFEYRIYPNIEQRNQINQHFGAVRWVYNFGLETKIKAWTEFKKTVSRFDIQAQLPKLKQQPETEWLKTINSQSLQAGLENLEKSYINFFRRIKTNKNPGFPKFKSKHNPRQSFQVPQHVSVDFESSYITLPKIDPIKIRFHRPFTGIIKTITVKQSTTKKYFVSILVETSVEPKLKRRPVPNTTIGIDLGIKDLVVLSTGEKISNPKTLKVPTIGLKLS